MKRFLKLLNEFINWREYKRRKDSENHRLRSELEYCRELLVDGAELWNDDSHSNRVSESREGEINAYVAYIKRMKEDKRAMLEALNKYSKK